MTYQAGDIKTYISQLEPDRAIIITKLINIFSKNLPKGFKKQINYNMPSFVVPHSIYPDGYHCDSNLPLPFISLASQKHFIAIYHMGIYSDNKLLKWFQDEYKKEMTTKLDMGKCCIRFKNMKTIPFNLIEQLATKINVDEWINMYSATLTTK